MPHRVKGIHHITAIAGSAARNYEFYTGVLGLRLVKKTVNFDDTSTYHLYYGNETGEPGTILTFFPWEGIRQGRAGAGQVTATAFSVPPDSLQFWSERLERFGVFFNNPYERFGQRVMTFLDPDGLKLDLVAGDSGASENIHTTGEITAEHAIRGFHSASLTLEGYEATAELISGILGFRKIDEERNRFRFINDAGGFGNIIDLICLPASNRGRVAGGCVHHIAFRVSTEAEQLSLREELIKAGYNITPQLDRNYFKSVYFREPGGVLFEIATDAPGFMVDEDRGKLGHKLMLPPWLEGARDGIESALPLLTPDESQDIHNFVHKYIAAGGSGNDNTLLLLHGTGGDEQSLLPLANRIAPGWAVLSPRGKILENGMPRFFKRLAEGVFDLEDMEFRTRELAGFVRAAARKYGLDEGKITAAGYSNGANMAASMMLTIPGIFKTALMFHPMVPFRPDDMPDLSGTRILITAGNNDPIVPFQQTDELAEIFRKAGAQVEIFRHDQGHNLTKDEVNRAREYLSESI